MSDRSEKTGLLGRLPTLKSLKLQSCLYFKPGTHKIDVARLKIGSEANACVHLKGNRDGFVIDNPSILMTMMGITISAPRGLLDFFTGHKVHRRWDSIKVIDGIPYLNEWHTDTEGIVAGWDHRSTNILKKYGDSIPTSYDPKYGRRYTRAEYMEVLDDFAAGEWLLPRSTFHRVRDIPILGTAVSSGLLPKHIPYGDSLKLVRILSSTHSWLEPETREEKIADRIFRTLGSSIVSTSTELEIVLDRYERPGFIAVFGASNMIRATFNTEHGMHPPYNLKVRADVDLKRFALAGLLDVRDTDATISSQIRMIPDKLPTMKLHVTNLHAPIKQGGISCAITDGRGVSGAPKPGISVKGDELRRLTSNANLHARCNIPTPRGDYIVEGNVLASMGGRWNGLAAMPRFTRGNNAITVSNLSVRRAGSHHPLIANARLIISDSAHQKQRIKSIHPKISMINSGFAAQLQVPFFNGKGISSGSAATYIHVPLNKINTHYDLKRFSLQNVLEVAFRFATEDRGKIVGNISAERRQEGWKIIAHASADKLRIGAATITNPSVNALVHLNNFSRLDIHHLLATTERVTYEDFSLRNARLNIKGGILMLGQQQATVLLDKYEFMANGLDTGKIRIARAALTSRSPSEILLSKSGLRLRKSSSYFSLLRLRPRGSHRSFKFRGHIGGRWKGKRGLLNIRLSRPTMAGTHLVISRISSYRKGSRLTAAFCLRKPTNLASLRSMGIQSKGIIWLISGSDHMPLTASAILGQMGINNGSVKRSASSISSASVRQRCERVFGIRR